MAETDREHLERLERRLEEYGLVISQIGDIIERLDLIESRLNRLLADEAVGNVLKGPFRLPRQAFQ